MIKVFCDRCGKEVTQAYTIDIKNGTNDLSGGMMTWQAIYSLNEKLYGKQVYCEDCVMGLLKYLEKIPEKELKVFGELLL